MPPSEGIDNPVETRIQRLEESLAFMQHEGGQLEAEVLALGRRVIELSRRVESLERQLQAAQARTIRGGTAEADHIVAEGAGLGDGGES